MCCLQVVQLEELLEVRHSVFVVGNAGTGKTQVWKTLFRAYQNMKYKPVFNDLNPKAVTNDELFGIINPNTREWKDGEFIICIRLLKIPTFGVDMCLMYNTYRGSPMLESNFLFS
jgi:AAA domain (dynein-related subfamily).